MGARIGQQLLIRHPEVVDKAVLCSPNSGSKYGDAAAPDVESRLNNHDLPRMEKIDLCCTDDEAGKQAAKDAVARLQAAVAAGTSADDFDASKETIERQDRARTRLRKADNSNFEDLANVKVPVLVADGRAFVFHSRKQLAATVNAFLR